jgi:hypothetical protein
MNPSIKRIIANHGAIMVSTALKKGSMAETF